MSSSSRSSQGSTRHFLSSCSRSPSAKVKIWASSGVNLLDLEVSSGLLFTSPQLSHAPSQPGFRQVKLDSLIDKSCYISVFPGHQRFLLRHGGISVLLNLTSSPSRNRLVVLDGMKIWFCSGNGEFFLTVHSNKVRKKTTESVQIGPHVDVEDESSDRLMGEKEAELPTSFTLKASTGQSYVLNPPASVLFMGTDIPLPFETEPVAYFSLVGSCLHLVLPRLSTSPDWDVFLEIPQTSSFPLKSGDALEVLSGKSRTCTLQLDVARPARGVPKSQKDAMNMNLAQEFALFALQTSFREGQRWENIVDCSPTSTPRLWSFPKESVVSLGSNATVFEPDPTLSAHHATVSRIEGTTLHALSPAHETTNVFLLVGMRQAQNRPPLALRLGDVLSVGGYTSICVVFQQRGNRVVLPPERRSPKIEMALRVRQSPSLNKEAERNIPIFHSADAALDFFHIDKSSSNDPLMVVMVTQPMMRQFFLCSAVETTFGSAEQNTVSIPGDSRISPVHCRVFFDEKVERWMLEDLESSCGTFLKVRRESPLLLCPGDVFVMNLTVAEVLGGTPS